MGVRNYLPSLGRFLQTDPVVGGSANDYDYANQDPVNTYDLDGMMPTDNDCLGAGICHNSWRGSRPKPPKCRTYCTVMKNIVYLAVGLATRGRGGPGKVPTGPKRPPKVVGKPQGGKAPRNPPRRPPGGRNPKGGWPPKNNVPKGKK